MRVNYIVSSLLILAFVMTGCVTRGSYDEQKQQTEQQRKRAESLEAVVEKLDKQVSDLEAGKTLSNSRIANLTSTVDNLEQQVRELQTSQKNLRLEKNRRIDDLKQRVKSLEEKQKALETSLETAEKDKSKLSQTVGQLTQARNSLERKVEELRSEQAKRDRDRETIVLSEKIYFKRASASLTPEHKKQLNGMIQKLVNHPERMIIVEGHADAVPISKAPFSSNWDLSAQRASSVVEYLAKDSRLDRSQFIVKGRGEYDRAATDSDKQSDQALDRRVVIKLVSKQSLTPSSN